MLILFVLFTTISLLAQTVSLSSMLDEMVDRNFVTRFPDPVFVCVQASSYDHAAKNPAENWFIYSLHLKILLSFQNICSLKSPQ
jgi:hypothetical protein